MLLVLPKSGRNNFVLRSGWKWYFTQLPLVWEVIRVCHSLLNNVLPVVHAL